MSKGLNWEKANRRELVRERGAAGDMGQIAPAPPSRNVGPERKRLRRALWRYTHNKRMPEVQRAMLRREMRALARVTGETEQLGAILRAIDGPSPCQP